MLTKLFRKWLFLAFPRNLWDGLSSLSGGGGGVIYFSTACHWLASRGGGSPSQFFFWYSGHLVSVHRQRSYFSYRKNKKSQLLECWAIHDKTIRLIQVFHKIWQYPPLPPQIVWRKREIGMPLPFDSRNENIFQRLERGPFWWLQGMPIDMILSSLEALRSQQEVLKWSESDRTLEAFSSQIDYL